MNKKLCHCHLSFHCLLCKVLAYLCTNITIIWKVHTWQFTLVIAIMVHQAYMYIFLCLHDTLLWSLPSWSIRHTCVYFCAYLVLYIGHCHHGPSGIPVHMSVLTWHSTLVIAIMVHQVYMCIRLCLPGTLH